MAEHLNSKAVKRAKVILEELHSSGKKKFEGRKNITQNSNKAIQTPGCRLPQTI